MAGNTFSNLSYGVVSEMPAGITMAVGLNENTFDNNFQGINAQGGVANLIISKNDFKIPEGTTGWNPTGVTVAGSDGYDISDNTFERCSTCLPTYSRQNYGIVINNGHMNNTMLFKNTFEDIMVASVGLGTNGVSPGSADATGLQFKCNNYDLSSIGIGRASIFYGVPLMAQGRINPKQGFCTPGSNSSPAGNQFNVCGSTGGRIKIMDYAVDQHVDYYNNGALSAFDPGTCVDFTVPFTSTPILLSNIGCSGMSTSLGDACPTHNFWDPVGNVSFTATDFLHRINNSTDPDEITALKIELDHFLNQAARYYVLQEQYDSAAALMASYNKYRQAVPMYIMAGDYTNAQNMVNLLPLDSLDDSLFAWQAQLAVNLYSNGKTYYDLDSASSDSMATIAQYNKAAGYMAGACAALVNTGYVTWPIPGMDSVLYDSLLLSVDTSVGAKMAHQDITQRSSTADNESNLVTVFPNPSAGMFTCTTSGEGELILSSVLGQKICTYTIGKGDTQLSVPKNLAAGVYLMRYVPKGTGTPKEFKIIYQP